MYAKTSLFCYDPGYTITGSCVSAIGNVTKEGNLYYRGYHVKDLVEKSSYIEVCFILLYGKKPVAEDLTEFGIRIKEEMHIHQKILDFYKGFQFDAHPMSIMVSVVAGLSSFVHSTLDVNDHLQRELSAIKLIAKMPVLAAIAFRTSAGLPIVPPQKKMGYVENFLYMMFQDPMDSEFEIPPIFVEIMEKIFILHADCEQGPSTTAVRMAGSSLANPFAAISAGIASLWGSQHGGAAEECLKMFREIKSIDNIPEFINQCKHDKAKRLWGFGHRIFKAYDPRATILKDLLIDFNQRIGVKNDSLFEIALEVERQALADDYFVSRGLYPNIDFYSGLLMRALHIPENMFNVIFAITRSIGWIANWREMMGAGPIKIFRPRQIYVGHKARDFVPIDQRDPAPGFSHGDNEDGY
uniref:Citrate synthase n=1 Tax=Strombidium inclinatum TaxID=197538 RepID=A0A7S3IQ05_9SPIT|mmetsp:Transcript_33069/g.50729  ORF Transcript_33069/g.50729 Transcript_33069/m.50729 type:complete len:411 (+) Transcript_33069:399-1631(+)